MKIKQFTTELDKIFSIKQAEDFDNVGLLCGNPEREVSEFWCVTMRWKML